MALLRVAVTVVPLPLVRVAVTVAAPSAVTLPVDAVKVALAEFAGTVTDAGTIRLALLDAKPTVVPPFGAALERVTVQVVAPLDAKVDPAHCNDVKFTGSWRDKLAEPEDPFSEALTVPL
jgi:hypothetical protein